MMSTSGESAFSLFANCRWLRLNAILINTHSSAKMIAHPVSVMEAIVKGVSIGIRYDKPVIFHIRNHRHTMRIRTGDKIILDVLFFQAEPEEVQLWGNCLVDYLADPVLGRNYTLHKTAAIEERTYADLKREIGPLPDEGELCLEFLTPFPFKQTGGRQRTHLEKGVFVDALESRCSRLFGTRLPYLAGDDNFCLLPYYLTYTEYRHQSRSQPGHVQLINGCTGKLYLKGKFANLLPHLICGNELHVGTKLSSSQGYYMLHPESQPYFARPFPNKKTIVSVIRDVQDRYKYNLAYLSPDREDNFNGEKFSDILIKEIADDIYTPLPNNAFFIYTKHGTNRLVEQLHPKDLIVQKCLLKSISKPFNSIAKINSLGFRKEISWEKLIKMIQASIDDDYKYVINLDIEDFFAAIDFEILSQCLDFYLPEKDNFIKELIIKSISTGYILNGDYLERLKGLANGSPLSVILTNLYLEWFDEKSRQWDIKIIRYVDNFIILTRTEDKAVQLLSETETVCCESGLRIRKGKDAIKRITER